MKYTERVMHGRNFKFHDFDSIHEFTSYLDQAKVNRHFYNEYKYSQDTGYSQVKFCGSNSYAEAQALLANGWTASAQRISKALPIQTTQSTTNRTKPTYNVVGGQASVPRYLQGIPTNMVDRKQTPTKQKIIVINRDISFRADATTQEIEREGIKALQIIQLLENKGYRVKLNVFWQVCRDNETVSCRVTLKKPEERLSILKVAFPIAHPSMLRRICFRWLETHPTMTNRGFVNGYGRPNGYDFKHLVPESEYIILKHIGNVDEYIKTMGL